MSKDVEKLKKIIGANDTGTGWIRWDEEVDLLAKKIHRKGFRDITDLRDWLLKKETFAKSKYNASQVQFIQEILGKLEKL